MTQAPAGWYPQPDGTQRYWDGSAWTEHIATGSAPASAADAVNAPAVVEPVLPIPEAVSPIEIAPVAQTPVNHEPGVPAVFTTPPDMMPGMPKKKSRLPLIIGIIGGALVLIVVAVVLIFMFVLKAAGGPKDAVNDFVSAVNRDDCEAMTAVVSERYKSDYNITSCEGYEGGDEGNVTYEINEVTATGSTATITGTLTDPSVDETFEVDFGLVKEGGKWKVDELIQG